MSTRTPTSDATRLFERSFQDHAEYHGDEQPKKDAATARRSATALRNAANNYRFSELLEPEQLLGLKAAANVMTKTASALDEVCKLSRGHFKKCEAERQRKAAQHKLDREAELDALAAARWTSDEAVKDEAQDLAEFFLDRDRAVEAWIAARRRTPRAVALMPEIDFGSGVGAFGSGSIGRVKDLLSQFSAAPTDAAVRVDLRRAAAACLDALSKEKQAPYFHAERHWHYVTLADFQAWGAERADRRRTVALAIGSNA